MARYEFLIRTPSRNALVVSVAAKSINKALRELKVVHPDYQEATLVTLIDDKAMTILERTLRTADRPWNR